jgi:hypothetical protein
MRSMAVAGKAPRSTLSDRSEIGVVLKQAEEKPSDNASVWDDDFMEGPELESKLRNGKSSHERLLGYYADLVRYRPSRTYPCGGAS